MKNVKKEIQERMDNVAIKSPDKLKEWLLASDRAWVIFNSIDLVDSLPWPEGVDDMSRVVACYARYRQTVPSSRVDKVKDPVTGESIEVPKFKTDQLEKEEVDRLIRFLIRQQSERFPEWKLDDPPL